VPEIGPACIERLTADTVFRVKRNGEASYWHGHNLHSAWNGTPALFDLCD
jgi:restriction system protein